MAYTTHSDSSPDKNTSYINTSLNRLVQNNPYHPAAPNILWPTYYDVFVNKTDDQQVSVSVSDEKHLTGSIDVSNSNALYMNHKPRLGSTVIATDETAVIDTGLTDYNHGIIYFSTLPTGSFTLTYLADPDKYYGEYLSQMQDVLHKLEIWAGAGSTKNEGVRSAEVLVKSTNAKIDSKLPKRIHVQGLAEDISFKSLDGQPGHTITLGNSNDVVEINASEFKVYCGTFGDSVLDPITGTITDHTGDVLNMIGLVSMSPTGTTRASGLSDASVTGLVFNPNVDADTGRFSGNFDALRVYGNAVVLGNLHTLGTHTVVNAETTMNISVFQEGLSVNGDSWFGDATDDKVYVAGDLIVSGKIDQIGNTTEDDVTINRDLILGNHNGTTPSLVDGLDPSYIANRHKYMRPAGPDWCGDTVNICSIGQMAEDGTLTGGAASTATQDSTTGDLVVDTSMSINEIITGDLYYANRFNDGTWIFDIRSGPSAGEKIPIAAYNSTDTGWQLSRTLSSLPASGMSYRIYNPYFCNPDFVTLNGNDFDITASTTNPVVADVRGIVKSNVNADTASVNSADSGTKYLSLANENSVASAGLESDGVWYGSDYGVPSDQSILVAEAEHNGGSTFDQLTTYRPAGKYDSTWRKFASTTPTIYHNLGGDFRAQDYKVTIHTAGTSAAGPGAVTQITTGAISPIDRKTAVIEVPSTDTWVRIKIEV